MFSHLIKPLATLMIATMVLCGIWQLGLAGQVYAKACLAQYLLESAWRRTLTGERNVRPWPWADTWPVGELTVPRLGIKQIVLAGDNGSVLAFAPGHTEASALPGKPGITLISGHRDTSFGFLKDLRDGDTLKLKSPTGSFTYVVSELAVVDQRDFSIDPQSKPLTLNTRLMLVTCYPFNALQAGGNARFVVLALGTQKTTAPKAQL